MVGRLTQAKLADNITVETGFITTSQVRMNERLREASQQGDIEVLYTLIREDANLLDRINQVPFIDTPLHIAASVGHTRFAMEMVNLKPSFARKLNQDGFSPMHLALQNEQHEMVLRLLDVDGDLVRIKGREGLTPLHFAAQKGMVDLLAEFLIACPKSIQDLTIRKETALHIAVKNDMFEALEVMFGWLLKLQTIVILNWADDEGNTILHIAAYRNQFQVLILVIRHLTDRVDLINAKNLEGLTALDILEQSGNRAIRNMLCRAGAARASSLPRVDTLADFLRKHSFVDGIRIAIVRLNLISTIEDRSAVLVCAVLIATATFQAIINPPGGVRPDDNSPATTATITNSTNTPGNGSLPYYRVGTSVANTKLWFPFSFFNSIAFLFSVLYIWTRLPGGGRRYNIILFNILPLIICYVLAMLIVTPDLLQTIYLVVFILVFVSVMKAMAALYSKSRVDIGHYHSLLKRWPSFHREVATLT